MGITEGPGISRFAQKLKLVYCQLNNTLYRHVIQEGYTGGLRN